MLTCFSPNRDAARPSSPGRCASLTTATSVSSKIMCRAAEHRLGAGHIIHDESGQTFALLYKRLKSQDVDSTFGKCEEALR